MVKCEESITYTISGLTFKNIEHICIGLDELISRNIDEMHRQEIIELSKDIDKGLPEPKQQ